jgi:hypothetical protein
MSVPGSLVADRPLERSYGPAENDVSASTAKPMPDPGGWTTITRIRSPTDRRPESAAARGFGRPVAAQSTKKRNTPSRQKTINFRSNLAISRLNTVLVDWTQVLELGPPLLGTASGTSSRDLFHPRPYITSQKSGQ